MFLHDIEKHLDAPALLKPPALPFPHLNSGKVREIYDLGDNLLILASDRLSAFDVILPNGIPGKGMLLTQLSLWWFQQAATIMPHHLADDHSARLREILRDFPELVLRSMLVKKLKPLPIEAVVRGYLTGSAWKTYRETGVLLDIALPKGMQESERLPQLLFTPTTKAAAGHDLPLTEIEVRQQIGSQRFDAIRDASFALFKMGTAKAQKAGILLADTKFEFGTDGNDRLYLIDEVLTPDSSRYWPQADYAIGRPQNSYDKQYVRDYLETLVWNKTYPGPTLPDHVVQQTQKLYWTAMRKLLDIA